MIVNKELQENLTLLLAKLSDDKIKKIQTLILENQITEQSSFYELKSQLNFSTNELNILKKILQNLPHENTLSIVLHFLMELRQLQTNTNTTLVWTGPLAFNEFARNTRTTMLEMINSAKKTITLMEFVMTPNPKEIFNALINAAKNGVKIRIIFNNGIKERVKMEKLWEKRIPFPMIFTYKPKKNSTSLHAKVLIVDSKEILTTSANLTDFGINENVEMGIRHEGSMAKNAENIVDLLIEKCYLVEVPDGS